MSNIAPKNLSWRDLGASQLARTIFKAELPEQFIRTLPAQSLLLTIRHNGLGSSADLIRIATIEQCRLLIDFDCWEGDRFHEDNFWEWLSLTDAEDSLEILQKLTKCFDLKLVSLLIARYVQVVTMEEPTEAPPAPGFYTPDNGSTWLSLEIEDSHKHFLLARLLALIFETNAELFYQLIAVTGVGTPSQLEEEAFQDKTKRLAGEGIPDAETAAHINSPLPQPQLKLLLVQHPGHDVVPDIQVVTPLVYEPTSIEPLASMVRDLQGSEDFMAELTLLMNAAIVFWHVDFSSYDQVQKLAAKVRGALNIGLERALESRSYGSDQLRGIYDAIGLKNLYRAGLAPLFDLRSKARRFKENGSMPAELQLILEGARELFPSMPANFTSEGIFKAEEGILKAEKKPFENLREIDAVLRCLERQQ